MSLLRFSALLVFCWSAYTMMTLVDGKCLHCSTWNDSNCIENLTAIEDARFCALWCFTKVHENGTVERGCMDETLETEAAVKENCVEPNCRYCDASVKVCNKHTICKNCDSSKDADCSQTSAEKDSYNSICEDSTTSCVAKVRDTDKHVERRCATDGDVEADLTKVCTGSNCNTGVYPPQRRRCYQCDLSSNCAYLSVNTDIVSKPCLLYDADEQCNTLATGENAMMRGCRSDSGTKCGSDKPDGECAFCNTDNCNNLAYYHDQTLRCVQCKVENDPSSTTTSTTTSTPTTTPSAQSAAAAAEDNESTVCSEAKNCQQKLLYTQPDACYSQVKDGFTHYGCLYDRDVATLGECNASNGCSTCTDADGCNRNITTEFTCIRCRTDVNPDCLTKADTMEGQKCTNAVSDPVNDYCYTGTWNDVLIRGCLVDADPRMQRTCQDNSTTQCTICQGINCNRDPGNGAAMLTIAPGALLLMLGVVFNFRLA